MTTVPLDLVKVQIYSTRAAFILGQSIIGAGRLGGAATAGWVDVLGEAVSLRFNRGGKVAGPTNTMDVGRLTISILDACDPLSTPLQILPGRPIRVLTGATVLWTGTLETVRTTYPDAEHTLVTLTAADAVKQLGQVKAIPAAAADDETVYSRIDTVLAGRTYTKLSLWYPAVQIHNATPNYLPDWGTWGGANAPALAIGGVDAAGYYSSALSVRRGPYTGNKTITAYDAGATYSYGGVVAGATYTVTMVVYNRDTTSFGGDFDRYALGVDQTTGDQWGESVTIGPQQSATLRFTFKATKNLHVFKLAKAFTGIVGESTNTAQWFHTNLYVLNLKVYRQTGNTDPLWPLAGCALDDTLANHLDIACNSAGLDWWIDRAAGGVMFRYQDDGDTPALTFSDTKTAGHINYLTDIEAAYDTSDMVNSIELRNHTIGADGKDQVTSYTFTNAASIATYGVRAASIDTSLPPALLASRAAQLLIPTPRFTVSSLSVNVLDYPSVATLDLFTDLQVIFRRFVGTYQIVGIEHVLTATTWRATLDLRKE
jgi:hypothetical protein